MAGCDNLFCHLVVSVCHAGMSMPIRSIFSTLWVGECMSSGLSEGGGPMTFKIEKEYKQTNKQLSK